MTIPPTYGGSLFVSDLATGLSVTVTSLAEGTAGEPGFIPAGVTVVDPGPGLRPGRHPARGPDPAVRPGHQSADPDRHQRQHDRRIELRRPDHPDHPAGRGQHVRPGLQHLGRQDASSFVNSELSITFSADGTTFYASDGDGVWQFKTTASLAGSTSGTLIGLNDLRTLGVPYDGQNSAVAVVDTGVDANSAPFRGRVAPGKNIYTGGLGNQDFAASGGGTTDGQRRRRRRVARAGPAAPAPPARSCPTRSTATARRSPASSPSSCPRRPSSRSRSSPRSSRRSR